MAAVQGVLDRVLPATPPRRFVKGEGKSGPSGSGSCGPGAMVLTGVCAVGGVLLTMQTVSHINTLGLTRDEHAKPGAQRQTRAKLGPKRVQHVYWPPSY